MKTMKKIVLLLMFFCVIKFSTAQTNSCATDEVRDFIESTDVQYYKELHRTDVNWWTYWRSQHSESFNTLPSSNEIDRRSNCRKARILIPVAVHVVHNNGIENITIAQAQNAIDVMNTHFANVLGSSDKLAINTDIQFVLARFDTVISTLTTHHKLKESGFLMGKKMANTDTFLNIWVVKTILTQYGNDTGTLGYATYPGRAFAGGKQGVVIRYSWFGTPSANNNVNSMSNGDVLSHECGHYLGLLHPFEGGCVGLDAGNAYSEGDLCKDVPAVSQPNQDCYTSQNTCAETYSIPKLTLSPNPVDQKQLFMDYSLPDCKTSFTNDQTQLMFARLQQYRPTLGSPLFMPKEYPNSCFSVARIDGITGACNGDSIILFTYNLINSGSSATYKWELFNGTSTIYTVNGGPRFAYKLSTGLYSVRLTVTNNGYITKDSLINKIEILDCSKRIASTKGNWEFGNLAGLNFTPGKTIRDLNPKNANSPTAPNINSPESSAGMSDSLGQLLFYAAPSPNNGNYVQNGKLRIWGKNYIEISTSPLDSVNLTAMQPSLIVPYADSIGKYYLFYNTRNANFAYYAIVDPRDSGIYTNGNNYYGRVTRKGFTVLPDTVFGSTAECGEVLSAVPQCNSKYHWLFLHNLTDGKLGVFDVSTGEPAYHSNFSTGFTTGSEYQVIFNPQGTKFHFGTNIYNFDRSTGTISLYKTLNFSGLDKVWGAMWSANGKILYRTEGIVTSGNPLEHYIYQYDLESSETNLNRTLITLSATYRIMQLGPDGKIYIATDNQPFLAEIQNPNAMNYSGSNECKFEPVGVLLKLGTSGGISNWASLPNLINAEKEIIKKANIDFSIVNTNCRTVKTEPNICCAESYKWLWGDGTVSTGRIASHTYSNIGIYKIGLIINATDTVFKYDTAQLNSADNKVLGPKDTICDNTIQQEFSMNYKGYYTYQWRVTNGTIGSILNNTAQMNLAIGTAIIKGIITDSRKGCADSSTKTVFVPSPILNNLIDSNQVVCDTSELKDIVGSYPTGGNGNYLYKWYYKSLVSKDWIIISGVTGKDCSVKSDGSYQYLREVVSGASKCKYSSSILTKILISELAKIESADSGCTKIFKCKTQNTFGSTVTFRWQNSADSLNWTDIVGATGLKFEISRANMTGFYRLKVMSTTCTLYSVGIKPLPPFTILKQPKGMVICKDLDGWLSVEVKDNYNSPANIRYQWQVKSSPWANIPKENNPSCKLNASMLIDLNGGTYRCEIRDPYCEIDVYSDIASVGTMPSLGFVSIDSDKNISSGIPIKLEGKWHGERNVCYAVWQRSKNPEGGVWDSIGKTGLDSFTVVPQFTECQQRWYYRIGLRNICPDIINWNFFDKVSKPIEVGAYQKPLNHGDLWIPDSRRDNGSEPNWIDSQNFTGSQYLWNRNWRYKYKVPDHWKWENREDAIQADRDTNFIHVMVYNRGNQPATSGKINLYWTVMSLNEDWPYSWVGSAIFYNDSIKNDNGKFNGPGWNGHKRYPMGGRINKTPIDISVFLNQKPTVNYFMKPNQQWHPDYNGILNPGDSVMITYAWVKADTVPEPGWYYMVTNKAKRESKKSNLIGMCMLARLIDCDSSSFGFTYPEKINTGSDPKKNIGYNIVRNNNIVSSNYFLGYMNPPFSDTCDVFVLGAVKKRDELEGLLDTVGVRDMKLTMCVDDPRYFNDGEVLLTMSDELWTAFDAAGKPGTFITSPGRNEVIINNACAEIGPISLPDTFKTMMGLTWRYKPSSNPATGTLINTLFTLSEYNDTEFIGSSHFGIKSYQNGIGVGGGHGPGGEIGAPKKEDHTTEMSNPSESQKLSVTPNPFDDFLNISYSGQPLSKVRIEMYNSDGKLVKSICDCTSDSEGKVAIRTETENLSPGNYTIRAVENGKTSAEKVIRCE